MFNLEGLTKAISILKKEQGFGTKAIHAGQAADSATGAIMTPIYQTSTYAHHYPGKHQGYEYSRSENPTRLALERNIASLENGNFAMCFGSGMAAVDAVMKLLKPGDEVIASADLYGGTYRLFKQQYEKYQIAFHFIDLSDLELVDGTINNQTKLIWIETPSNPLLKISDISAISKRAKRQNILLAADNTFASPYLQNPLTAGADIVMHSVSKYLGGHSDLIMGALATKSESLAKQLYSIQNNSGAIPGPQDCFLVLRGIKTLHLRMERHCENTATVAHFLKEHPKVAAVYWPGFKEHEGHEIAKNQMRFFGGMLSFELKEASQKDTFDFMSRLKLFTIAQSLGGVESLCAHPASMSHASVPKEEREKQGIRDQLIRLSVGIEDADDLINDIEQAFQEK